MRSFLIRLVFSFFFFQSTFGVYGQLADEGIYEFVNSLSLKKRDDVKLDNYFLAKSAEQHLGPRIKADVLKDFESHLTKEDIQFMVDQFNNPVIINWDQKKLKKATVLTPKQQKRKRIKGIYYLEQPFFNKTSEYAVFKYGYSSGNLGFNGCILLYQKPENGWQKVKETWCMIS